MAIVPPKVLLIRFSSIGDIVLTTPVIRTLHQQLGAEVHLLTKKSFGGVLAANPYVQRTWTIEKKVGEVLPALRREGFTLARANLQKFLTRNLLEARIRDLPPRFPRRQRQRPTGLPLHGRL